MACRRNAIDGSGDICIIWKHSTGTEDRWNVIGKVDGILFVVYTERKENIRIISARKATKEETNEYYDGYDLR